MTTNPSATSGSRSGNHEVAPALAAPDAEVRRGIGTAPLPTPPSRRGPRPHGFWASVAPAEKARLRAIWERSNAARVVPLETRFFAKIEPEPNTGCWIWLGYRDAAGYGKIRAGGRVAVASRVSLSIAGRPLPDDKMARHSCDFPPCVNPSHLLEGTNTENMADAVQRGQILHGEQQPQAKLTSLAVAEIRARAPHESQRGLALEFGVSQSAISLIVTGQRWRDRAEA